MVPAGALSCKPLGETVSITELLSLRGPVVGFSAVLSRCLGDEPIAALLFCQMVHWTQQGARESSQSTQAIYEATGVTIRRQEPARALLRERGWIAERHETVAGKPRLFFRVCLERVAADVEAWQVANLPTKTDRPQNVVGPQNVGGEPPSPPTKRGRSTHETWSVAETPTSEKRLSDAAHISTPPTKRGPSRDPIIREEKIRPAMRRGDPRVELMKQADADLAELKPIAIMAWDEVRRERPEGPHGGSQIAWELFAQKARRELLAARDRRRLRLEQGGKR